MNVNNQMFNLFKNMKQAYAEGDNTGVEQCAAAWSKLAKDNPFVYDTPAYDEFFKMQRSFQIWAKGGVDRKINRRRMLWHAQALCELNPPQPYVYDKKAEQEEKKAKEEWIAQEQIRKQEALKTEESVKVVNEEPQIVLGVIPEKEKKSFFKRLLSFKKEGEEDDSP